MDEKILKSIEPIVKYYTKIQTDILLKIIEHFKYNEEFINSDFWRIKKLQELGVFNKEVVDYIARETKKTPQAIRKALKDIGIETVGNYKGYLFDEELLTNEEILSQNPVIRAIMDNAYNETTRRFIQMSNKIKSAVIQTYLDIVEENYLKTSMGISYDESIRDSIKRLSKEGIHFVDYTYTDKKGNSYIRQYDITSTVRREILTATRQLSGNLNMELIKKTDAEYVYLSEHLDCRPQHYEWQGTIIKTEDLTKPLPEFPEYGSIIGIHGINCRHYFEGFFGDPNEIKKKYTKEQCDRQYTLTQKQRQLERTYRKWKLQEQLNIKADATPEQIDYCNKKANEYQKRIIKFTDKYDLERDFTREYIGIEIPNPKTKINNLALKKHNNFLSSKRFIENVNDKELDKKIKYYEEKIVNNEYETAYIFQKNGDLYEFIGDNSGVSIYDVDLKDAIIIHNHPIDGNIYRSFGEDDFNFLVNLKDNINYLKAITPEYDYYISVLKKIDIGYNDIYMEAAIKVYEDNNLEIQHEAMNILKDKGYVKYERRIKTNK